MPFNVQASKAYLDTFNIYPNLCKQEVLHMTEKKLKKLNRYQLLELLLIQTERADKLQAQLDEAEKKLNDKEVKISTLGSVADASLQLSGVFEAAQDAAEIYISSAKKQAEEIEAEAIRNAEIIESNARKQAKALELAAQKKAKVLITQAIKRASRFKK